MYDGNACLTEIREGNFNVIERFSSKKGADYLLPCYYLLVFFHPINKYD